MTEDWREILKQHEKRKKRRIGLTLSTLLIGAFAYFGTAGRAESPSPVDSKPQVQNEKSLAELSEEIIKEHEKDGWFRVTPQRDTPKQSPATPLYGNLTCHMIYHPDGDYKTNSTAVKQRVQDFYREEAGINITFRDYNSRAELPKNLDQYKDFVLEEVQDRDGLIEKITYLQKKKFEDKIAEIEKEPDIKERMLSGLSIIIKDGAVFMSGANKSARIKALREQMSTIKEKVTKEIHPKTGGTNIEYSNQIYLMGDLPENPDAALIAATTMAHEIGHGLKLKHTHEVDSLNDFLQTGTPNLMAYQGCDRSKHGFGLEQAQKEKIRQYAEKNLK